MCNYIISFFIHHKQAKPPYTVISPPLNVSTKQLSCSSQSSLSILLEAAAFVKNWSFLAAFGSTVNGWSALFKHSVLIVFWKQSEGPSVCRRIIWSGFWLIIFYLVICWPGCYQPTRVSIYGSQGWHFPGEEIPPAMLGNWSDHFIFNIEMFNLYLID